jgi:hypothetical protein
MRRLLPALSAAVALGGLAGAAPASARVDQSAAPRAATTSVFATGFNNPRGLTFGPHFDLFVAEGGLGGSNSTTVQQCPQIGSTGSTADPVLGGRISKISRTGVVSTVVDSLPSSQTTPDIGSLVSGVSSVAFLGNRMYALLAGAGCSHGVPEVPNGVIRVRPDGTWSMIADLSAFQAANPVANPPEDFDPDGTWFSMAAFNGALYPMDSNHGELDRVTERGGIRRISDISAEAGHIVPTAIVRNKNVTYISALGVFGPTDAAGDETIYRIGANGTLRVWATGVEKVLGLAFRLGKLYALEMSTSGGGPVPGTGAIVRVGRNGPEETIVSGLTFPTGIAVGPDRAFYVSNQGFGFPAGAGQVLRIEP